MRREAAMRQYSVSSSMPMLFRRVLRAATMVVPVPQKGSRTVSPTKENIWTSREASSRGRGAGCSLVKAAANDGDVGMEWDHGVPAGIFPARETDVAHHANQTAKGSRDLA